MNDRRNLIYQRATYLQIGVCGLLFSLFSFGYLYFFQPHVIEALHYALAHGKTHYSPLAGALIITLVLLIFRWGINKLLGLKGPVRTLAYLPPCLLLGVLTDVHRDAFHGGGFADYWQWLLPLSLGAYVAVVYTLRRFFRQWLDGEFTPGGMWNCNLAILLAECLMTVGIGTTDVNFHHELAVEHALRDGDTKAALAVGRKSLEETHTLTALRAYALSLDGSMGERLFEYPQTYGAEGLLFPRDHRHTLRIDNDSLAFYLGGAHRQGERALDYLERRFYAHDGVYTAFDYYLCALLLDKQLDRFVKAAEQNFFADDPLPRYYAEAIALYHRLHPGTGSLQADADTEARLDEFLARRLQFTSPVEEKNRMRREYGDTYWWYYRYQ